MEMDEKTTTVDKADLKLPGFKDLLGEVETKQALLLLPQPKDNLACCILRPEAERFHGQCQGHICPMADKLLPLEYGHSHSSRWQGSHAIHALSENKEGYKSAKHAHIAIKDKPYTTPLLGGYNAMDVSRRFHATRLARRIDTSHHLLGPPINLPVLSNGSSAGKINSTEKHKLSEKHRRDEMGVCIQAADFLRKGLDPGRLFGCGICADELDEPNLSFLFVQGAGTTAVPESKKTKNEMVVEELRWIFFSILHRYPHDMGIRLDNIRSYKMQLHEEREKGRRNDPSSEKHINDSRPEVLEGLLRDMEAQCKKHGVSIWGSYALTPPVSVSAPSPIIGQKRSRHASDEPQDDEELRMKLSWPHSLRF